MPQFSSFAVTPHSRIRPATKDRESSMGMEAMLVMLRKHGLHNLSTSTVPDWLAEVPRFDLSIALRSHG
jgi:hypothetical protein